MSYLAQDFKSIFGTVKPPAPVEAIQGTTGAEKLSSFLTSSVSLIFTAAGIVFVFMILWGGVDWLLSGGEKEKLAGAQKRIVNAIIGLLLLSAAFAIIGIIGTFTGFELFKGQNGEQINKIENQISDPRDVKPKTR